MRQGNHMKRFEISDIENLLNQKYARGEVAFRTGEMRSAAEDLYTEDAIYLTPMLTVLRGRDEIIEFFEKLKPHIGEVRVHPVLTWGDPDRVVYQFCNTVRRAPGNGEISHAHYFATFRRFGDDWLCESEVVSPGHIDVTTASKRAAAASN